MNYLNKYSKRLRMGGESSKDALLNRNKRRLEHEFSSSPSYYEVDINDKNVGVIINKKTNYDEKLIHFKQDYDVQVGSIVKYKNDSYLIMEKDFDELYSFAIMKRCNQTVPFEISNEEVFVGYGDNAEPIYKNKTTHRDLPCVVDSKYYSSNENSQLPLPEGKLSVYTTFVPESSIQTNEEFNLYEKRYIVADVDYTRVINGTGVMEIIVERKVGRTDYEYTS